MKFMRSLFIILLSASAAHASGHGPVFSMATPTNSQGETSIDVSSNTRLGSAGSDSGFRTMVTYGFTPHLQLSLSVPGSIVSANLPASTAMSGEMQATLGWRFHHRGPAVGKRFESTLFTGVAVPELQRSRGLMGMLKRTPGVSVGAVTGMASRSHYVWVGGSITHFFERDGDQRPQIAQYSLAYGYRPPSWRKDSGWDWRLFGEAVGEYATDIRHAGFDLPGSHTHQVFVGPTTLGIYKNFAISGGVLFPVYRDAAFFPRERLRIAINFSYFIFHFSGGHQ
jgi:hypothetical protein